MYLVDEMKMEEHGSISFKVDNNRMDAYLSRDPLGALTLKNTLINRINVIHNVIIEKIPFENSHVYIYYILYDCDYSGYKIKKKVIEILRELLDRD